MTGQPMTTTPVALPTAPPIPGLRFRLLEIDRDLPALVDLIVESSLADDDDYVPSIDDLRNDLEHTPDFESAQDMILAELDGQLVGASMRSIRARAGTIQHQIEGWVRPANRRRGIGRALVHWQEARGREVAASWAGPEPHVYNAWVSESLPGGIGLFEAEGYARVRYGFTMIRSLAEPIPDPPLPDGLEIRPVAEADHRRIWDADTEAFRDHWEAAVRTEEDFVGWYSSPNLDPSLWRVAWDGDEVAGSSMNFIFPDYNEKLGVRRGWLEHISVRRPWRRRGLAAALIANSLRELKARGFDEAALGVDAENPTGALRLYESLGFRRHRTGIAYRKHL